MPRSVVYECAVCGDRKLLDVPTHAVGDPTMYCSHVTVDDVDGEAFTVMDSGSPKEMSTNV